MSGGSPPTNTFRLNRSPCSEPAETGEERAGEPSALTHMDRPGKYIHFFILLLTQLAADLELKMLVAVPPVATRMWDKIRT